MTTEEKIKVRDESNDHIYFTVTPRLVWALSNDPEEYTFWCVVKDIAGEKGECILAREDLAILAMVSTGTVTKCREGLMRKKLLLGDFRRDPGYPQKVWHLSIPDFWDANTRWARKYPRIADRIAFKKEQLQDLKDARKEASPSDALKEPSPSDRGISPDDGGVSPDDTKNNVLKIQKEEGIDSSVLKWLFESICEKMQPMMLRNHFTFLQSATPVSFGDSVFTLAVCDDRTRDWLDDRLSSTIDRLFPGIIKTEAEVKFVVLQETT